MATIKETIPFNYDEIYTAVQDKFVAKGYDIQEGSNTMQLVSAMSYLVSMLNANTAININETLLTLARKRNNILQDSRILGYEPGNKVSYQYKLKLLFTPNKNDQDEYISTSFGIPKYSVFTANSKNYYYMGDIIRIQNVIEPYEIEIDVKEGTLIKSSENESLNITIGTIVEDGLSKNQYYIDIPFSNVEDDGIDCSVNYYDINGIEITETWTKFQRFEVDSDTYLDKQFFRLNVIEYNLPRIYLKLPNSNNNLRIGTKVNLNVLLTSGSSGSMIEMPKPIFTDEFYNCEVKEYILKLEGTEEETNESIRYNAPLFYNSANRAVTKNDYISICNRFTFINKTCVWDGNDEYPTREGIIWFSFIPQTVTRRFDSDVYRSVFNLYNPFDKVNWFMEEIEINGTTESIFNRLEHYKIPTLKFLHRHPIYFDFNFTVEILKYNIALSETKQNTNIFNVIDNYFYLSDSYNETIENFDREFFLSNLIKRIDTTLTDLSGVNISLSTSVQLSTKYIYDEGFGKKISIPLGLPYVKLFDNSGDIIIGNLPNIETVNFFGTDDLILDYSSLTGNESNSQIINIPILLKQTDENEVVTLTNIGTYKLFNKQLIIVDFELNDVFTEQMVDNCSLDISYKDSNIKFVKNTIPRLKMVNFI